VSEEYGDSVLSGVWFKAKIVILKIMVWVKKTGVDFYENSLVKKVWKFSEKSLKIREDTWSENDHKVNIFLYKELSVDVSD